MLSLTTAPRYKEKALKSLSSLPPFSPTLNRLLATLANDDLSFAQLATLIEKDTVLAGSVLKTVNSSLYSFSGTINSVSHAISIMGLAKLRNTALGFSVNRIWKGIRTPPGWSMARFNMHSLATAIMADHIAQHVDVDYAEGAFVSGLFHDLGQLLIATAMPDQYHQISRLKQAIPDGDNVEVQQIETQALGVNHSELSASALKMWNLPLPVQMAVLYHHDPDSAPREVYGDYNLHLGHVVCAANRTVNDMGIRIAFSDLRAEPDGRWFAALGLNDRADKVLTEFQREFESLESAA